ncbi:hypothetical protein [Limnothrix redekei]|uniref:GUN4-like domain-containing protein n=1 Tax=Limnothrix redekei LRLZ20PSL1 TaxID=3112953 RepID=A0ABW7CAH7_9CYAN
MPNNEDTSSKVSGVTLPYGVDDNDILRLIDAIKRKPDNEKAIKEIYNKSNFETARKALEIFGILDNQFSFSLSGKNLAIEREGSRKQELFLGFFLSYPPYGHFLENLSHTNALSATETESVKDYWWKHNYGSSGNNREEGVVTFGKLIQLAGLGKFISGRRGKPSRIEWSLNAKTLIDKACTPDEESSDLAEQFEVPASSREHADSALATVNDVLDNPKEEAVNPNIHTDKLSSPQVASPNTALNIIPNISINVDMSDWDNNKIITFFKAAYGIFDDGRGTNVSTSCPQSVSEPSDGYSAP